MRSFLGTDRVKIYQFAAGGSSEVIAESMSSTKPSLLRLHFRPHDISRSAKEMFLLTRQRSIVDVTKGIIRTITTQVGKKS